MEGRYYSRDRKGAEILQRAAAKYNKGHGGYGKGKAAWHQAIRDAKSELGIEPSLRTVRAKQARHAKSRFIAGLDDPVRKKSKVSSTRERNPILFYFLNNIIK